MMTERICKELQEGDATAAELAVFLNAAPKLVAGTCSNLLRQENIEVVATRGRANVYRFVRMPVIGRPW